MYLYIICKNTNNCNLEHLLSVYERRSRVTHDFFFALVREQSVALLLNAEVKKLRAPTADVNAHSFITEQHSFTLRR